MSLFTPLLAEADVRSAHRLVEYLRSEADGAAGFLPWLAATEEQVLDLTTTGVTHFDAVLSVSRAGRVKMVRRPEELVFLSAKTSRPSVAPWVRV